MPEGDSIANVASAMRPLLLGRRLASVRAGGVTHARLAGHTVVAIEPVGKHLLVTTDGGVVIRSHLGMNGRWSRHPASRPPPAARAASLVLATAEVVLVCTRAAEVELLDRRDPRLGAAVARLGPDVLADDFDPAAALARVRALPAGTPIASALLDQRVACGIGNVYKCEVLFVERTSPWAPVDRLDDAAIVALYRRAAELMRTNLRAGPRRTAPGAARYWVYRRAGQPCARCRTPVRSEVTGGEQRRTYWCPTCQALPAPA